MRIDRKNTGVGGIDTLGSGIHRALVDARRCHDAAVVVPTFRSAVTHVLRSIGHCCFDAAVPIHFSKQCMWKTCVHSPQISGQSSPGTLHDGQHPS